MESCPPASDLISIQTTLQKSRSFPAFARRFARRRLPKPSRCLSPSPVQAPAGHGHSRPDRHGPLASIAMHVGYVGQCRARVRQRASDPTCGARHRPRPILEHHGHFFSHVDTVSSGAPFDTGFPGQTENPPAAGTPNVRRSVAVSFLASPVAYAVSARPFPGSRRSRRARFQPERCGGCGFRLRKSTPGSRARARRSG